MCPSPSLNSYNTDGQCHAHLDLDLLPPTPMPPHQIILNQILDVSFHPQIFQFLSLKNKNLTTIKHVDIVHISPTVIKSICSHWLICLSVFNLRFPVPFYFPCSGFTEETELVVLKFLWIGYGFNSVTWYSRSLSRAPGTPATQPSRSLHTACSVFRQC